MAKLSASCAIDLVAGDASRQPDDLLNGGVVGPAEVRESHPPAGAGQPAPDDRELTRPAQSSFDLLPFRQIWLFDFEFVANPGENPEPICLVAWELRSGRKVRRWRDEFGPTPPYPTGPDALFVAFYASAEIGCHLALGWPVPERVLDLFTEFRNRTNGVPSENGSGLLGALAYHGLDGIGAVEKDEMRTLILRGGPWSDAEQAAILDYCESDVAALGSPAGHAALCRSPSRVVAGSVHGCRGTHGAEWSPD
jgi:hypothetical protein